MVGNPHYQLHAAGRTLSCKEPERGNLPNRDCPTQLSRMLCLIFVYLEVSILTLIKSVRVTLPCFLKHFERGHLVGAPL